MTVALDRQDKGATALSPMELIQQALTNKVPPEVIRELVALQQSMERFNWEREERQAEQDFGDALTECQRQIGLITPNVHRENNIWWADYVQIDKTVRPIYLAAGFALSFSDAETDDKGRVKIKATLKRGRIEREYFKEISRAAANSSMKQPDADASASSRAKRYLILDIFNIAVGIDKAEKDGVPGGGIPEGARDEWEKHILSSANRQELQARYLEALGKAEAIGDPVAIKAFIAAKDKCLKGMKS